MKQIWARPPLFALAIAVLAIGCGSEDGGSSPAPRPEPDQVVEPADRSEKTDPAPPAPFRFVATEGELGVDFVREDDIRGQHRLLEANGGGVAVADFDRDGRLDLFFTNGCRLPLSQRTGENSHALYRGGIDGFENVTGPTGLVEEGYGQGVAVGDVDGDGFDDLYVCAFGRNGLWLNNGDGTFDRAVDDVLDVDLWSTSAAFGNLNGDGHLDLYVVNYVVEDDENPRLCPTPAAPDGFTQCPPTLYDAADDVLLLNDGRGNFVDATALSGLSGVDGKGLGVVILDFDRNGRSDVYVANDGTPNFLYLASDAEVEVEDRADDEFSIPRFVESAAVLGGGLSRDGRAQASMGIACGDYDQDGWADLFVTHFHLDTNTLYRNLEGDGFEDETRSTGLGPPSRPLLGFGTEFADFDNDGRVDLVVANGHVDDRSWTGTEPYQMPAQAFHNRGEGRFVEVGSAAGTYFAEKRVGRGLAVADLDDDGRVDFVVTHQVSPATVQRNDTPSAGGSIVLRLVGTGSSNRSAVGTRVHVEGLAEPLVREVVGGASFHSSSDRRVHIGLGELDEAPRIHIVWPDGRESDFEHVAAGEYVVVQGLDPRRLR